MLHIDGILYVDSKIFKRVPVTVEQGGSYRRRIIARYQLEEITGQFSDERDIRGILAEEDTIP